MICYCTVTDIESIKNLVCKHVHKHSSDIKVLSIPYDPKLHLATGFGHDIRFVNKRYLLTDVAPWPTLA